MPGTIEFKLDTTLDIVVAVPHWKIETEADCQQWMQQYLDFLLPLQRKVDMVLVLDDFVVAPGIGSRWGEFRARLIREFTRHSFRVHSSRTVQLFVNTSGARYDAATGEAASVDDAIAGILHLRRQDAEVKPKRPEAPKV